MSATWSSGSSPWVTKSVIASPRHWQPSSAPLNCLSPKAVREVVDAILDAQYSDRNHEVLHGIIRQSERGDAPLSHADSRVVRDEVVADLLSVICMSEAWRLYCGEGVDARDYAPERLLLESIVSMVGVIRD